MSPPNDSWARLLLEGPNSPLQVTWLCHLLSPGGQVGHRLQEQVQAQDKDQDECRSLCLWAALAADFLCAGCHLAEAAEAHLALVQAGRSIVDFITSLARGGAGKVPKVRPTRTDSEHSRPHC